MTTANTLPEDISERLDTIAPVALTLPAKLNADASMMGRYNYVSVDHMYGLLRTKLFEAGIVIHQTEADFSTFESQGKLFAQVTYQFQVYENGGVFIEPSLFTVVGQLRDPQSCGALRSYGMKYFLRNFFMLATGDADEDKLTSVGNAVPRSASQRREAISEAVSANKRDKTFDPTFRYRTVGGKLRIYGVPGSDEEMSKALEKYLWGNIDIPAGKKSASILKYVEDNEKVIASGFTADKYAEFSELMKRHYDWRDFHAQDNA